jgi:hypothetical protein
LPSANARNDAESFTVSPSDSSIPRKIAIWAPAVIIKKQKRLTNFTQIGSGNQNETFVFPTRPQFHRYLVVNLGHVVIYSMLSFVLQSPFPQVLDFFQFLLVSF